MRVQLAAKAAVVCVLVAVLLYLPGLAVLVATGQMPWILGSYGDFLYVLQGVILGAYGYWLGQRACGEAEAVSGARIWRFLSRYGLILVVMLLVLYILRNDVYWPFDGLGAVRLADGAIVLAPGNNFIWELVRRCLSRASICSYLVLYLSYGWARSGQPRQSGALAGICFVPVATVALLVLYM